MFKFNYYNKFAKETPTDRKNTNILSLVLFKQSTLEDIVTECLPFAKNSEFQVHYRSVIVRLRNATNELIVTVPTAFFNFEQEVEHSSVNFETSNEAKWAQAAQPSSINALNATLQEFPALQNLKNYAGYNGFEYSIVESNSGSIHRHPGDFSFSGIDRDKSPDEPGVIYRHLNAVDAVKTDSVIYIPSVGKTKIVTTETRIVNVAESTNGITGTYTEVPTITCVLKDVDFSTTVIDTFSTLLGDSNETTDAAPYTFIRASGATSKEYPLVTEILDQFARTTCSADISNVVGQNITQRIFTPYKGYGSHKSSSVVKIWDDNTKALVPAEYNVQLGRYVPIAATAPVVSIEQHVATRFKDNTFLDYDEYEWGYQ